MSTVSECRPSASDGVGWDGGGDGDGIRFFVWVRAIEDIFGAGGNILCRWSGGSSSFCLFQKATTIPPYDETNKDREEKGSDDSTRESTLAHTRGVGLFEIGYALNRCTLCAGPIRMLKRVEFG